MRDVSSVSVKVQEAAYAGRTTSATMDHNDQGNAEPSKLLRGDAPGNAIRGCLEALCGALDLIASVIRDGAAR